MNKSSSMKVAIFGTGYVGLVSGVCLSNIGHHVICVDNVSEKIDTLNEGNVPIYEPGLEELIKKNRGRLEFTTDAKHAIKESDIIFIAVGTPQSDNGSADLTYVKNVVQTIGQNMDRYKLIVVKSTVPVGTGDLVEEIIKKEYKGEFSVASNPEFLKEGTAIEDFMLPDRIVVGVNDKNAGIIMENLYKSLNAPMVITDRRSSEFIKYASNAFLATKISFINSIANLAEILGADVKSIANGMGFDKRIGHHFLRAGIGYGGSCFPKDVQALIHIGDKNGYELEILKAVESINKKQKLVAVQKLEKKINLKGATIGILGLSFKPDTDDLREAPSLAIIKQLIEKGAKIRAWDPISENACQRLFPQVHYCPSPYEAAENADAVILVTEWTHLKNLQFGKLKKLMKNTLFIDGRNILDGKKARKAGLDYIGIGR